MRFRRITCLLCSTALLLCACTANTTTPLKEADMKKLDDGSMSAMELADAMQLGWNLGNSLDAYANGTAGETAWGNPEIRPELFEGVKKAGFQTVRIPVSYLGHVGEAPDYTIDAAWLDRIAEVTDMALDAGLLVIINIHHDGNNDAAGGAWIDITAEDQTPIREKFALLWAQIADRFRDYDERLVFEGMNEIHDGTYQAPSGDKGETYYANVNALGQLFVDTVRDSGGSNLSRCLLVPGYNTNIDYTLKGFVLPKDRVEDRLMLSVHFYDPYQYALEESMSTVTWGEGAQGNCGWGNEDYVDAQFDRLQINYINNGIPVIIGEYGAIDKNEDAYREYYMEYVTKAACDRGLVPVYWDNGYDGDYGFALFDREDGSVLYPDIVEGMTRAASGRDYTVKSPT